MPPTGGGVALPLGCADLEGQLERKQWRMAIAHHSTGRHGACNVFHRAHCYQTAGLACCALSRSPLCFSSCLMLVHPQVSYINATLYSLRDDCSLTGRQRILDQLNEIYGNMTTLKPNGAIETLGIHAKDFPVVNLTGIPVNSSLELGTPGMSSDGSGCT